GWDLDGSNPLRRNVLAEKKRLSSLLQVLLQRPSLKALHINLLLQAGSGSGSGRPCRMGNHSPNDDKGPTLLILSCLLCSLAVLTTILRCWVPWGSRKLGIDDGLMALTTILSVGRISIQIASVQYGNGKHREFVTDHDYQIINMLTWYTQVLLFPTICLMKVSICLLILRIKDTRTLRHILGAVITGLVLTNFECLVVLLAECSPLKAYWNGTYADHCWPAAVRIYSIYLQASYGVATDLICTGLPIYVVWSVSSIPLLTKTAVCGLMSLGLVATVCSAIRAASLRTTTDDLSYAYCIAAIWANTELFLGIIAANLALSRSIYKYFTAHAKKLVSNTSGLRASRTPNLRNSLIGPSRMGYVMSSEGSMAFEATYTPHSIQRFASAAPLEPYKTAATFFKMDEIEKGNR
ncbi:hypothetical protein E4T39_03553, partial [Aureobasidium subglaciale]